MHLEIDLYWAVTGGYIVENDTPDVTPLQTAEVGYEYLRNVTF